MMVDPVRDQFDSALRRDVFDFGVLLYQLLFWDHPFAQGMRKTWASATTTI